MIILCHVCESISENTIQHCVNTDLTKHTTPYDINDIRTFHQPLRCYEFLSN